MARPVAFPHSPRSVSPCAHLLSGGHPRATLVRQVAMATHADVAMPDPPGCAHPAGAVAPCLALCLGAARDVGQVQALLVRRVEDVLVVTATAAAACRSGGL